MSQLFASGCQSTGASALATVLPMNIQGLISLTPGCSVVKNPPANAGDAGSIPGSGRSPGEGNGNPLQYPCLGNPMDRGVELGLQVMESQKESDII